MSGPSFEEMESRAAAQVDAMRRERDEARAEVERLQNGEHAIRKDAAYDQMTEMGYRFCDNPACNCGRWHIPARAALGESLKPGHVRMHDPQGRPVDVDVTNAAFPALGEQP